MNRRLQATAEPATSSQEQPGLFSERELSTWLDDWQGMPEFVCESLAPKFQLLVSFASQEDLDDFARAIGQPIVIHDGLRFNRSIWYPAQERRVIKTKRWRALP